MRTNRNRHLRRSTARSSILAAAVGFLGSLLLVTSARAIPDVTQRGPYAVGYTILNFDKTSVTTGEPRHLQTSVWYPAVSGTGEPQHFGLRDADVVRRRWPLVLFSHGYPGLAEDSSFLHSALASWGFVVAGPLHPGEILATTVAELLDSGANRVPDLVFVIDAMLAEARDRRSRFSSRIDPDRIGVTGHSFGGVAALAAPRVDGRIAAALPLDPAADEYLGQILGREPVHAPTMILWSELGAATFYGREEYEHLTYDLLVGPRYFVELLDAGHLAYSDECPLDVPPEVRACETPGTISQEEAHRRILSFAVPFLKHYVARDRRFDALLSSPNVPGVIVRSQVPGQRVPLPRLRSLSDGRR